MIKNHLATNVPVQGDKLDRFIAKYAAAKEELIREACDFLNLNPANQIIRVVDPTNPLVEHYYYNSPRIFLFTMELHFKDGLPVLDCIQHYRNPSVTNNNI
jgi:hypothetical protein